jgi:hypothetical protein
MEDSSRRLEDFAERELIASGSFSQVYRCIDHKDGSVRALKIAKTLESYEQERHRGNPDQSESLEFLESREQEENCVYPTTAFGWGSEFLHTVYLDQTLTPSDLLLRQAEKLRACCAMLWEIVLDCQPFATWTDPNPNIGSRLARYDGIPLHRSMAAHTTAERGDWVRSDAPLSSFQAFRKNLKPCSSERSAWSSTPAERLKCSERTLLGRPTAKKRRRSQGKESVCSVIRAILGTWAARRILQSQPGLIIRSYSRTIYSRAA